MRCPRFSVLKFAGSIVLTGCLTALGMLAVFAADGTPALSKADLDVAVSRAYLNGEPMPTETEDVLDVLGLSARPEQARAWIAGSVPNEAPPATFHYVMAFKRPMPVGSLLVRGGSEVSVLNAGVSGKIDPADASQWTTLTAPSRHAGGALFTLEPGFQTKAVRVTERRSGRSQLETVRLFKPRYQNITPAALAYARHEYTPPNSPNTQFASLVTAGAGTWASSGKDNNGQVSTPPITDINPEWFILTWDQAQPLHGLWLNSNIVDLTLDHFVGPEAVNPRVGTEQEWKRVRKFFEQKEAGGRRWIFFDAPLTTRGIRINILKTEPKSPQVALIDGLHALQDLGDRPVVDLLAQRAAVVAPVEISYELQIAGKLTMVVNDAQGVRQQNLLARIPAVEGKHKIGWNLKDERGEIVPAGEYRWSAIVAPEFQTKYEFTAYPNVAQHAPENAPWLTGVNGSGGWLADHSPNQTVCATGDRVYFGATVAESGVSFIECDLEGRKTWGHHSFAAWTGPKHLAADQKTIFVGAQILGETGDMVWGVDKESKQVRKVIDAKPTASRARGISGLTERDGKLYLSVRSQEDWLINAAAAEDVDLPNCHPVYREARKPRVAYEMVPNPQNDFVRLFRLAPYPPGHGLQGSLTYLHTLKGDESRQHIVLAFRRPVPLGSVAFPKPVEKDLRVVLSVLKSNAKYPPDMNDEKQWTVFPEALDSAWDVIAAPEDTQTRALRITFVKGKDSGEDDLLADVGKKKPSKDDDEFILGKAKPKKVEGLNDFGAAQSRWLGQLEGMKLLRRRFQSVADGAEIHVNSGVVADDGVWDAQRTRPITPSDPGIYVMQWDAPKTVRGVAIKEIDGQFTKIDVYTGPKTGAIDIAAKDGWEEVGSYEQGRRDVANGYGGLNGVINPHARYVDGYVDFGRDIETRAVRLRVVQQWADKGQSSCLGIRLDLGGGDLDPKRCRIWGVTPIAYVGGEPPVDNRSHERIEIYDSATGKLTDEIPLARPGAVAFSPKGELFALSGKQIVRVPQDGGKSSPEPFLTDLVAPTDFVFDKTGKLYVYDGGPERQNVRVYDSQGKLAATIGEPGGFQAGPWVPERMGSVSDIDLDERGQLWIVENQYWPKRITLWTTAGEFRKEFLGNTAYGGGGVLDPGDKTRLYYGPLEFELDWKTGTSRLKNLTWLPGWNAGEVPIRVNNRKYMVNRPQFAEMPCGIVYHYEQDHLKLAAAMGPAMAFDPLKREEFTAKLDGKPLSDLKFLWSDRNDNGEVDIDEVEFSAKPKSMYGLTLFNNDLSVQASDYRYAVKEFLPSGVPIFEEQHFPKLKDRDLYRLDDGTFFRLGDGSVTEAKVSPDGRELWTYVGEGAGVQAAQTARPYRPDQVISQFGIVGHATAEPTGLGEFFVIHTNVGAWNIWTADGLLVGPLFRDLRDPASKPWSMSQHDRGMELTDLTVGQEHFAGWVSKNLDDGKFYAVAGHNHASVVEILGLDQVRRYSGTITVTEDDVQRAREFEDQQQQQEVYARSPVLDVYRVKDPPEIDGKLTDWPAPSASLPAPQTADFRIAYDDEFLFVSWRTSNMGPLKNTGRQWDRLFKSGASVDLQWGLDPSASPDRQAPEPGDQRLLITLMDGKPTAVLYRAVVPGTPPEKAYRVVSPVAEVVFDEVRKLDRVFVATTLEDNTYTVEAAIPLKDIGFTELLTKSLTAVSDDEATGGSPPGVQRLKLDWGVLTTGPDGNEVLRRIYWSNQATSVVADAPSEARLSPHLWGFARIHAGMRPSTDDVLDEVASQGTGKKVFKKDVTDILDELGNEKKK